MISKQLALSAAASVLAMVAFVLFGVDAAELAISPAAPALDLHAGVDLLPVLGKLLPPLQ